MTEAQSLKVRAAWQMGVPVARWQEFVIVYMALSNLCHAQEWRLLDWGECDEHGQHRSSCLRIERPGGEVMQFRRYRSTLKSYRMAYESVLRTLRHERWLQKERQRLGIVIEGVHQ